MVIVVELQKLEFVAVNHQMVMANRCLKELGHKIKIDNLGMHIDLWKIVILIHMMVGYTITIDLNLMKNKVYLLHFHKFIIIASLLEYWKTKYFLILMTKLDDESLVEMVIIEVINFSVGIRFHQH